MRNLCFAAALARRWPDNFAFVLAYVGGAASAHESEADFAAFRAMLRPDVATRVGAISYETIADVLPSATHAELKEWIDARLRVSSPWA